MIGQSQQVQLRVVGWNVESGGASAAVNAKRIEDEVGVDIWGLSEVLEADADRYETAAEKGENGNFERIVGTTGGADRLAVIFNTTRLKKLKVEELHALNIGGNVRAPLVVTFEGKTTHQKFHFMVNHLYRSKPAARHTQATKLREWAKTQSIPVIAVGDYNFDYHYETGEVNHDKGLDLFLKDGVFHWIRPQTLVPTNSSDHESVLDFVFVAGDASGWEAKSTILVQPNEWPDGDQRSDHRPVDCVFTLNTLTPPNPPSPDVASRQQLLDRIRDLEQQLRQLRDLVEQLN